MYAPDALAQPRMRSRCFPDAPFEPDLVTLAESLPQFIWVADADGSATYFNSRCYAFIGMSAGEALGSGWVDAIHPDDAPRTLEAWSAARQLGTMFEVEYRIREGATGRYRWFLGRGTPSLQPDGTVGGWIGTCTDIHDRKLLEDAVAEQAASFARLADLVPHLIWVADPAGNREYVNERWTEFTGVPRDALTTDALWAFMHPDDRERVESAWSDASREGRAFDVEVRLRRSDGAYHWFLARGQPVHNEAGNVVRWVGSNTDIDAQRQTIAREQRVSAAFQRAALPRALPAIDDGSIDAVYRAAELEASVGGDWYDAFVVNDAIVLCVGDVMGKGLRAAVTMNAVRQCIRGTAQIVLEPAAILDAADRVLRHDEPDAMVTAFIGILDRARGTLRYASAGHPCPLLRRRDGTLAELPATGLPIGHRDLADGPETSIVIDVRDVELIVLYTDGLVESTRDAATDERRLRDLTASMDVDAIENRSAYIADRMLAVARDDVTVLTLALTR